MRRLEGLHARGFLTLGSFAQANPSATASYGAKRLAALVGASYRRSDPYAGGSGRLVTDAAPYRPEARGSDAYRAAAGWGRLAFRPSEAHRLVLSHSRQEAEHVLHPYLTMDTLADDTDRGPGLRGHRSFEAPARPSCPGLLHPGRPLDDRRAAHVLYGRAARLLRTGTRVESPGRRVYGNASVRF